MSASNIDTAEPQRALFEKIFEQGRIVGYAQGVNDAKRKLDTLLLESPDDSEDLWRHFQSEVAAVSEGTSTDVVSPRTPLTELDLTGRIVNCLRHESVDTIEQLLELSPKRLLKMHNFGQGSLDIIVKQLNDRGLSLQENGA